MHLTPSRRVTIEDAPEHGREMPIAMADGEEVGALPLLAEVVPGAWRVFAPVEAGEDGAPDDGARVDDATDPRAPDLDGTDPDATGRGRRPWRRRRRA